MPTWLLTWSGRWAPHPDGLVLPLRGSATAALGLLYDTCTTDNILTRFLNVENVSSRVLVCAFVLNLSTRLKLGRNSETGPRSVPPTEEPSSVC